MTNKEKFLKMNVGFHFEDLPLDKQVELEAIQEQMNLSKEWIYLALSKASYDDWCKWGFTLFRKPEFKTNVDTLLQYYNKLDESKFAKEISRRSRIPNSITVSEATFNYVYDAVMKQGKLYEYTDEPDIPPYSYYWCYNNDALTADGKQWITTIIASGTPKSSFDDADKVKFCIACQKVKSY